MGPKSKAVEAPEQVVRPVLRHICTLVSARAVGMMLLDEDNRALARVSIVRGTGAQDSGLANAWRSRSRLASVRRTNP